MDDPGPKVDLVANRLTVVPAIATYATKGEQVRIRGRIGVTASNITYRPDETETEPSLGTWRATGAELEVVLGPGDRGPRSGEPVAYASKVIAAGKHTMMVSDTALLGVVQGATVWGPSEAKAGRLLVWRWSYGDIDEIRVGRIKRMLKMWDIDLRITTREPAASLHFSGLGREAEVFSAYDATAKAAKTDGSHLLGFATTLSDAIARHRGCSVARATDPGKDTTDTFTFTGR